MALLIASLAGCSAGRERRGDQSRVEGETPLHRASEEGDVDRARALLAGGARPNARDAFESTPLHRAAAAGHAGVAEILLAHGARPNARAYFDMTPLHWAAASGAPQVVDVLLRHGAAVSARNVYGLTPLHEARSAGVVARLLAAGARVDAIDDRGLTPLYTAYREEAARALLAGGAGRVASTAAAAADVAVAEGDGGLVLYAKPGRVRLRAEDAVVEATLRNLSRALIGNVTLAVDSDAVTMEESPRPVTLAPAQLVRLSVRLRRRDGVAAGEHPVVLAARGPDGKDRVRLPLSADTRRERTPEDEGRIRLTRVELRPPLSLSHAVVFVAPAFLIGLWWLWRRRSARHRRDAGDGGT